MIEEVLDAFIAQRLRMVDPRSGIKFLSGLDASARTSQAMPRATLFVDLPESAVAAMVPYTLQETIVAADKSGFGDLAREIIRAIRAAPYWYSDSVVIHRQTFGGASLRQDLQDGLTWKLDLKWTGELSWKVASAEAPPGVE